VVTNRWAHAGRGVYRQKTGDSFFFVCVFDALLATTRAISLKWVNKQYIDLVQQIDDKHVDLKYNG